MATHVTDITDPGSCAGLVALAMDRFGSVDALIQVAAYENVWGGLYDLKFEAWRKAFETNVIGALTVIRPVAEAMKSGGGGSIVLIGSQSMFQPALPQSGYAASKGALLSTMYYLCDELGPDNIRCNMIVPRGCGDRTSSCTSPALLPTRAALRRRSSATSWASSPSDG